MTIFLTLKCNNSGIQAVSEEKAVASRQSKPEVNTFVWKNKVEKLLLASAVECKTKKAREGVDWESAKTKYPDIYETFCKARRLEL